MIDLTPEQRIVLRECLCEHIAGLCESCDATPWCEEGDRRARFMATSSHQTVLFINPFRALYQLLGEWPVGHRGEKGWEKIECES
jgi:hypothetical protein